MISKQAQRISYLFIFFLAISITACGGGGGSSNASNNSQPSSQASAADPSLLCSGATVTVQQRILLISEYDKDDDGCLSTSEINDAIAQIEQEEEALRLELEEEAAALALKTVDADIVEAENFEVSIDQASLVGTSEAIDGVAQLYTNVSDGRFRINFEIFPSLNDGDTLFIAFSTGTAAEYLGAIAGANISTGIQFTEASVFRNTFECNYLEGFRFDCEIGGVTLETIDNSDLFDSLPSEAYLVLLIQDAEGALYRNHATIPVLLN